VATIILTVTNDLSFDQRMQRIAGTLASAGHRVLLVGRSLPDSPPQEQAAYGTHRFRCLFNKGFAFYAEINIRLLFFLLCRRWDAVGVVDLDTLPAGTLASLMKRKVRVFDAHEHFTEVPEVTDRPFVRWFWNLVARTCLPFYTHAYTVGPALAALLSTTYRIPFKVVRNVPFASGQPPSRRAGINTEDNSIILYQGALNEGRGMECMLQAMQRLQGVSLWIAGEGDLSISLRQEVIRLGLQSKVRFLGRVKPDMLRHYTAQAWLGINLLEHKGDSYYYSLANKYFDYVMAGVPVLTMNFPEYRSLQAQFPVAVLIDELSPDAICTAINFLMEHPDTYAQYQEACLAARNVWTWARERQQLIQIWSEALRLTSL
jgi:glycosyltransferase involved in cell wall biosynthesis